MSLSARLRLLARLAVTAAPGAAEAFASDVAVAATHRLTATMGFF
jgi:hypothetical protein